MYIQGRERGQWWPTIDTSNKRSAIFYCPLCGHGMSLQNHNIDQSGNVSPSVVEPSPLEGESRCGKFHEYITLTGF